MRSGVGSLTLCSGEVIRVRYSIEQIVTGGTITIVGEIRDLPNQHHWLGTAAVLELADGKRLRIIFNEPPRFVATGGYL